MSGTASGNSSSKNRSTSSSVLVEAKLRGPSNSQQSVQVNDPSGFGTEIDIGATVIEHDAHVRITLRRFDYGGVERGAADRINMFVRIDVVRREMKIAGFIVDHSAAHRDSVLQHFVGDAELLECVNPAR